MKRLYNWVCATLVVTACSPSALTTDELPTGAEGLTPLTLSATLDEKGPLARANGTAFEANDGLVAYLRHVTWDGTVDGTITEAANSTLADYTSAKLVAFGAGTPTDGNHPLTATTPLYWDDFSNSDSEDTDLRTAGHYLQAFYGYAVNGGTNAATAHTTLTTALHNGSEATGTLTWTVPTDQTDSQTQQECDLLWAKAQTPVKYEHATTRAGLTLPYTHALCRLTVALVAADGFSAGAFTNTTVTTAGLNKTATFSAPTAAITDAGQGSDGDAGVIQLRGEAETTTMIDEQTLPARSFSGLFVPRTVLTAGSVLATIANVDGNHYTLPLTSDILTAWADGLDGNQTQAAHHYKLTVTLRKQAVAVSATLADWSDVSAEAQGSIQFTADVPAIALSDRTDLQSFRLYRSSEATLTKEGLQSATTCTFVEDAGQPNKGSWTNDPAIYWANASTSYHFRALAEQGAGGKYTARADEDLTATQGQDLLWGTSGPDAIAPRTGTVPLDFEHLLSKLTVKLTTAADTPDTEAAKRVDLDGALLTLSPLATTGTVRLTDGSLTLDAAQENAIPDFAAQTHPVADRTTLANYIVLPQPLGNNVTLRLTLKDGTTYRVQLNTCTATVDETQQAVTAWERGRHYTYTLHVEKEAVRLAASVQKWVEVTGNGNANLDWD